jgi:dUTP pyrophosphatase
MKDREKSIRGHEDVFAAVEAIAALAQGRDVTLLKYKRLSDDAFAPRYATDGAACYDLFAVNDGSVHGGLSYEFSTGIAFEVPRTHVMLVFSRSGHGFHNDIRLSNCVGVIDSDYRGEVKVKLASDAHASTVCHVKKGDRIAQAMLVPIPACALMEVSELSDTARGTGGFGSTGN